MTPERWQQIDQLFHAALACQPSERTQLLAKACGTDEPLRLEVESLISSHEETQSFIETPAGDVAAEMLRTQESVYESGQQIGNYKLVRQLGSGGMGVVYLADDLRLNRKIALKLLPPQFTTNPDRVRRFEREARAASALNHPNIVTIYEIGQSTSAHFIATEFVDGKTLREHIHEKPFTLRETLNVAFQVASALSAAHSAGIVHRDIKPENIMVRPDGYVKILDFGLAKLAEVQATDSDLETPTLLQSNPGLVMGTVQYMSPEQARGKNVGVRTDIWSLGVVLYELLAGRVPFSGETPSHVMVSLMEDELPVLTNCANVPAELDRIVTKALRKDQKERYQTANEIARDLRHLKEELQLEARLKGVLEAVPGSNKRIDGQKVGRARTSPTPTVYTGVTTRTSSAEYLVNEIKSHRRAVAVVAIAMVIAATASYFYVSRGGKIASSNEAIDSVAILPFVNVNNDPNTEYLADGMSDSIINSLSRVSTLRVMSLNAVLRFKGKQGDAQAVGKALNVRAVLMGRVTQQGDNLIITTELVDVRDNHRLWGGQYNRKLSDILLVQNEIAGEISERLRLRLTGAEKQQLAKQYTANPEAYKLYTLGNYYFRQDTKEGLEKSIELYEQALKIDSNYAMAYAGLARTYHWMGSRGFWTTKESEQKTEWAALKGLQLDETLAEGHSFLAVVKINKFDWEGAEKELKLALELDPNSDFVNVTYWFYLTSLGRVDEALQHEIRTQKLHPPDDPSRLAFSYFITRQYDKSIELYRMRIEKKIDTPVTHIFLGETYLAKGMIEEGLAETQKGIALDDTLAKTPERWDRYPMLAYAYAMAGRRNEALKILNEQKKLAEQRYVSPYNFAIIFTGLGDKDQAFEYLTKAVDEHVRLIAREIKVRPRFDSLRSDPRYPLLLRRMNLQP
jgi:serine/threonine-protein kinase